MSDMYVRLFAKDGAGLADLESALDRRNFSRIKSGRQDVYHYQPGVRVRFTPESVTFNYESAMSVEEHRKARFSVPDYMRQTLVMALDYVKPVGVCTHAGVIDVDDLRKELGLRSDRKDERDVQNTGNARL